MTALIILALAIAAAYVCGFGLAPALRYALLKIDGLIRVEGIAPSTSPTLLVHGIQISRAPGLAPVAPQVVFVAALVIITASVVVSVPKSSVSGIVSHG